MNGTAPGAQTALDVACRADHSADGMNEIGPLCFGSLGWMIECANSALLATLDVSTSSTADAHATETKHRACVRGHRLCTIKQ